MRLNSAKDLDVYQKAYTLAMEIFETTKGFPPEERFALTGQIRRSSRSVCLNLREACNNFQETNSKSQSTTTWNSDLVLKVGL